MRTRAFRSLLALLLVVAGLGGLTLIASADDPPAPSYAYFPWVPNGVTIEDPRGYPTLGPFYAAITVTNPSNDDILLWHSATYDGNVPPSVADMLGPYETKSYPASFFGIPQGTGSGVLLQGQTVHLAMPMPIAAALKQSSPVPLIDAVYTSDIHTVISGYTGLDETQIGSEVILPIVQTNNNWNTMIRATSFDGVVQTQVQLMLVGHGGGSTLGPFNALALPGRTVTFNLLELGVPDGWVGSAVLTAGVNIAAVAERIKHETDMLIINSSRHGDPPANEQAAPLVFRDWFDWNTGISLVNLVNMNNQATIRFYAPSGVLVHTEILDLVPNGMNFAYLPASPEGEEEPFVGSAVIESQHPVHGVVDEVKYLGDPEEGAGHAMSYMLDYHYTSPDQRLVLPLFQKGNPETGSGDTSGVQMFNPTNHTYNLWLTVREPNGNAIVSFMGVGESGLGPKEGITFYSLNVDQISVGQTGSLTIGFVEGTVSGGVVAVSNNVNYDVQHDGSAAFNLVRIKFASPPPLLPPNGFAPLPPPPPPPPGDLTP